jgi:hypothetical protein
MIRRANDSIFIPPVPHMIHQIQSVFPGTTKYRKKTENNELSGIRTGYFQKSGENKQNRRIPEIFSG